jgi:hypothetical protein
MITPTNTLLLIGMFLFTVVVVLSVFLRKPHD